MWMNMNQSILSIMQAYVGLAKDLNAIVVAFRGTQENRSQWPNSISILLCFTIFRLLLSYDSLAFIFSIQNWMEDLYFKQLDLNYPGVTGAMVNKYI